MIRYRPLVLTFFYSNIKLLYSPLLLSIFLSLLASKNCYFEQGLLDPFNSVDFEPVLLCDPAKTKWSDIIL